MGYYSLYRLFAVVNDRVMNIEVADRNSVIARITGG